MEITLRRLIDINHDASHLVQPRACSRSDTSMVEPSIVLGIPLMDNDHAVLEAMLARAPETEDTDLADFLARIEAEIRAHFEREEALMQELFLPVFQCHVMQHEMLISKFQNAHRAIAQGDLASLRHFVSETLPVLLLRHMNTADRMTAGIITARP
ncbi:MAG: hemerythrin family protein, partial [Hyphomicrobium sp.]